MPSIHWIKLRRRNKFLTYTAIGISAALLTTTFIYAVSHRHRTFPELKQFEDLPRKTMLTYAESEKITFPNNEVGYENSKCKLQGTDWIANENKKTGVNIPEIKWREIDFRTAFGSALWIDKTSVSCGDEISVHASLYQPINTEHEKRTIHALRIGWYKGNGARDVWSSAPMKLKNHKVHEPINNLRMIETNWPTSLKFKIGSDWTPGFYLIVTENSRGKIENAAPLVVRSPRGSSKILLMHSFITWNLYNSFGGRSAYFGYGNSVEARRADRSRMVSMDRPIIGSGGYSIHRDGISMVQFLEKNGFNYDQESDLNIDRFPNLLDSYNELILSGHAEYMTRRIFNSIIAARNSGVNIAIFGGNTALWQTRTAESPTGKSRRIIMYRFAINDPVKNLDKVTIEFADKRINTPQALFTGTHPSGTHVFGGYKSFKIPSWLPISANAKIDGVSPDSEIEAVGLTSPASPPIVNIIFEGAMTFADPATTPKNQPSKPEAQVVWFTNKNGQATFNAGLTTWACNLVDTCAYSSIDEKSRQVLDDVTKTVISLWQERGVGAKLKN